jgi:hypothetical protein
VTTEERQAALGYEVSVNELNSGLNGMPSPLGLAGGTDSHREGVAVGD